jgi:hypothetical protein
VTFFVNFEATVRNDRSTEIRVSSEWACVPYAELRLESGDWKKALEASCISPVRDDPCFVVQPGGTHQLSNVDASFFLEKFGGRIPSSVTARFHLITFCKDGKAFPSEEVVTEPVKIDLPAVSEK